MVLRGGKETFSNRLIPPIHTTSAAEPDEFVVDLSISTFHKYHPSYKKKTRKRKLTPAKHFVLKVN